MRTIFTLANKGLSLLSINPIMRLQSGCNMPLASIIFWMTADSSPLAVAQIDPDEQVRVHFSAVRQADKAGDLFKAVSQYQAALKLRPDETVIYNNLGLVYHSQLKYREAIDTFQAAI